MAVRAKIPSPPVEPKPKWQMAQEEADQDTSANLNAETDTDASAAANATELDPSEANPTDPIDTAAPEEKADQTTVSAPADVDEDSASPSPAEPAAPKPREPETQVAMQDNPESAAAAPEQPSAETAASEDVSHDAPPAPAVAQPGLSIQAASFRTKAYADKKIAELKQKGYDAFIYKITGENRRSWYLVRFGHFENRRQADEFLARFNKEEGASAIVVRQE